MKLILFLLLIIPLYSQARIRELQYEYEIPEATYVLFATDELVEGNVTLQEAMALCEANVLRWEWGESFKNWVYPFWFREDFMTPLEFPLSEIYGEGELYNQGMPNLLKLRFLSHETAVNTEDVYDESVWVYWGTDINTLIPATTCATHSTRYHDINAFWVWGGNIVSKFTWDLWWEETPCTEKRRIPCIAKSDGSWPLEPDNTTAVIVFQSLTPVKFESGYGGNHFPGDCEGARELYEIEGDSYSIFGGFEGYPYQTQVPVLNPNLEIIAPSLESFFLANPPHESVCIHPTIIGHSLKPNGMLLANHSETCANYMLRDGDTIEVMGDDVNDNRYYHNMSGYHWLRNDCQKPLSQSDPQPCTLLSEETLDVYTWCIVRYKGEINFTSPTKSPTPKPVFATNSPTFTPSSSPTSNPTSSPTLSPTLSPSTPNPTHSPTLTPPTNLPTSEDNTSPSATPTRPDISTQKGVIVGFTGMFVLVLFAMLVFI